MSELDELRKEILALKERNERVEADKAWETSWFRASTVALLTYLVMVLFLFSIHVEHYWIQALVPSLGFVLSTLSLPFVKRWWIRRLHD